MKFQILDGKHQVFTPVDKDIPGGSILIDLYLRHDVVESEVDLALRHNQPGAKKFKRVSDETLVKCSRPHTASEAIQSLHKPKVSPVEPIEEKPQELPVENIDDAFSGLTIRELRQLAEEEEIDLGDATRKSDILKIFRADAGE